MLMLTPDIIFFAGRVCSVDQPSSSYPLWYLSIWMYVSNQPLSFLFLWSILFVFLGGGWGFSLYTVASLRLANPFFHQNRCAIQVDKKKERKKKSVQRSSTQKGGKTIAGIKKRDMHAFARVQVCVPVSFFPSYFVLCAPNQRSTIWMDHRDMSGQTLLDKKQQQKKERQQQV